MQTQREAQQRLGRWADPRALAALRLADARIEQRMGGHVDRTEYDRNVCQCCGFRDTGGPSLCVCAGLDWYQLPNGSVECQAHRFARAVNLQQRRVFDFGRLRGRLGL